MNKGYTLIELLGVIILLSIIMILVVPSIINMLKNKEEETNISSNILLMNAIEMYIEDNTLEFDTLYGNQYCVEVDKLIANNYLKEEITKEKGKVVKITYTDKYNYEIVESNSCKEFIVNLNPKLIPVIYDNDHWKVADTSKEWYNYENQEWANAVILDKGVRKNIGDTIIVEGTNPEAVAMFVWIPRYEYKIEGTYGKEGSSLTLPGEIEVNFMPIEGQITKGYKVHPAFTFGEKELNGMWVGKFETSHKTLSTSTDENNLGCVDEDCENAEDLIILPNMETLKYNNVSNFFYAARSMGNIFEINSEMDTHVMKNSEWGAVAYLTQSKYGKYGNSNYTGVNKEVYQNKSLITGRSNGTPSQDDFIENQCVYNDITNRGTGIGSCGAGASTTGNITGIYDMSGGANEYVMGYLTIASDIWGSTSTTNKSGFSIQPSIKYYDSYISITSLESCNGLMCYGHALDEIGGWYNDSINFINEGSPWMLRGGGYDRGIIDGIFYYSRTNGSGSNSRTFRIVIS